MDNSDIIAQKKALRQEMLVRRAKTNGELKNRYDQWVCEQLENIILEKGYQKVHAYLPMGKEIDISPLLQSLLEKKITVVVPKTLPKRKLENLVLTDLNKVEKGVFGTTHPSDSKIYNEDFDLIIVPGLAFDKNNYRLGYGGGYYDNFIVNHQESKKIGIFYPFQEVEKVPTQAHDVQLDEILINDGIV